MTDRSFLFLLAAARAGGNTEMLARRAAVSLPRDLDQRWVRLPEVPLAPFEDHRHDGIGYHSASGNERLLLDATLDATDIVIASPVYWYSVAASVKLYLDYWAGWMRLPEDRFIERMKGKTL